MSSRTEAARKRAAAVELAARGVSYDEIARRVGYSHRASAWRVVMQSLRERTVEGVDDLRRIQLALLDEVQSARWEAALDGDVRAATAVLRAIDTRCRLLGLL